MIPRAAAAFLLSAVVFACTGGGGAVGTGTPPPAPEGEVLSQGGLEVKAAFSAATLGDEGCNGGAAKASSDAAGVCAPSFGDANRGGCGGGCRSSTLQLSFTTSGAATASAKVEITAVTLHDVSTGAEVAKLTVSSSELWDKATSGYTAWNGTLSGTVNAQASYRLSTPEWSKLGLSPSNKQYRLQITLVIDGETLVLESDALSREPDVAT